MIIIHRGTGINLSNEYLDSIGGLKNDARGSVDAKYSSSMSKTYKTIKEKLMKGKTITFFNSFAIIDGLTFNGVTKEGVLKYCY